MRDPLKPIPSPVTNEPAAQRFWRHAGPPPLGRRDHSDETDPSVSSHDLAATPRGARSHSYDPTRLLGGDAGDLGLDRRSAPRRALEPTRPEPHTARPAATARNVVAAGHRNVEAIVGLCTGSGWALMRTLSLAPGGLLLQWLDLLDPRVDPQLRARGRAVLSQLAPVLGSPHRADSAREAHAPTHSALRRPHAPDGSSPLATVGGCLLAGRVVADASGWAARDSGTRSSRARDAHLVHVVVPLLRPLHAASVRASAGPRPMLATHEHASHRAALSVPRFGALPHVRGELVPLTDPRPDVLAVALQPSALARLELALRSARRGDRSHSPRAVAI